MAAGAGVSGPSIDAGKADGVADAALTEDGAGLGESCRGIDCRPGLLCAQVECFGDNGPHCVEAPAACADVFAPVCSCQDENFPNRCELERAGHFGGHDGECVVEDGVLKAGTWSGGVLTLVTTATSATVRLPCTHGAVDEPPTISDRQFHFAGRRDATWHGTYGPLDGVLEPAEYRVEMHGGLELTLEIVVGSDSHGPFTVRFGEDPVQSTCE
jgi:hypothetical protein